MRRIVIREFVFHPGPVHFIGGIFFFFQPADIGIVQAQSGLRPMQGIGHYVRCTPDGFGIKYQSAGRDDFHNGFHDRKLFLYPDFPQQRFCFLNRVHVFNIRSVFQSFKGEDLI